MNRTKPSWLRPFISICAGMLAAVVFGWVLYQQLFHGAVVPFRHDPVRGFPASFIAERRDVWNHAGLTFVFLFGVSAGVLVRQCWLSGGRDTLMQVGFMLPLVSATSTVLAILLGLVTPLVMAIGGCLAFRRRVGVGAAVAALNLAVSFTAFFSIASVFFLGDD